jgi:hypothetical protein
MVDRRGERTPGFGEANWHRIRHHLGSPRNTVIVIVPILLVVITFLFWYQTWFGRGLSDQEMAQVLADTSVPHKTQHALAQLSDRIARGDPTVKRWYPQLLALAQNRESQLRLEARGRWGRIIIPRNFTKRCASLIDDPVPLVRWNAALALVRFGDGAGSRSCGPCCNPSPFNAPRVRAPLVSHEGARRRAQWQHHCPHSPERRVTRSGMCYLRWGERLRGCSSRMGPAWPRVKRWR